MLNVVELALSEPVFYDQSFQLHRCLRGATARIFEPGDADDITSRRWINKTHQWLLHVRRSDGIGVLTIQPLAHNASIAVTSMDGKTQDLASVVHVLNRPNVHLLIGSEYGIETPLVFKAVCALGDDHPLMQWVRDSGPRKISW